MKKKKRFLLQSFRSSKFLLGTRDQKELSSGLFLMDLRKCGRKWLLGLPPMWLLLSRASPGAMTNVRKWNQVTVITKSQGTPGFRPCVRPWDRAGTVLGVQRSGMLMRSLGSQWTGKVLNICSLGFIYKNPTLDAKEQP